MHESTLVEALCSALSPCTSGEFLRIQGQSLPLPPQQQTPEANMIGSAKLSRFSRVRQPTRLRHPWDSPGKNTGVGCHFLLQCMKMKSESEVAQSCLTLRDPMDCSLPGFSIHGIFQARVLEWDAICFHTLFKNTHCI